MIRRLWAWFCKLSEGRVRDMAPALPDPPKPRPPQIRVGKLKRVSNHPTQKPRRSK